MKETLHFAGLKLVSENNAHAHWRYRHRRAKRQRHLAGIKTLAARPARFVLPLTITITRIAPRSLDSDNAWGSAKHVRDGIADGLRGLGVKSDADPRLTWIVTQEKGAPREYGVRVEVSWNEAETGTPANAAEPISRHRAKGARGTAPAASTTP